MITRHSAPSALLLAILAVGCQAVDRNNDHDDNDDHGDAKGAHAEGTEKKGDAHDDDEGVEDARDEEGGGEEGCEGSRGKSAVVVTKLSRRPSTGSTTVLCETRSVGAGRIGGCG